MGEREWECERGMSTPKEVKPKEEEEAATEEPSNSEMELNYKMSSAEECLHIIFNYKK
ncbi:hypothetical protein HPP92_002610 [Vanilla planifolia]|uniref:Uncharacterized protein n=1 Tax=Vanilla planifolia TaxID=51239 RepID=A0A835VEN9_VANPL|nr:hypothetical protein HPP92_002610 [Vanilla planifolia]